MFDYKQLLLACFLFMVSASYAGKDITKQIKLPEVGFVLSNKTSGVHQGLVELYHDDGRCNANNLITGVNHSTDCSTLSGLESVWGIKFNGVCQDVSDLSAPAACQKYKIRSVPSQGSVEFYHDDGRCNVSNLITGVNHSTDCSTLSGLESVWGIKLNGVCQDVSDLSAPRACQKYKVRSVAGQGSVEFYHDDGRCNVSNLITGVNHSTDCSTLSGLESVWGIKLNGVCQDVSDLSAPRACRKYKIQSVPGQGSVEFYHDDGRCNADNLITGVNHSTDCSTLSGLESVWGIKLNGVCQDVSDLSAPRACQKYKIRSVPGRGSVKFYHDDGRCNADNLITGVNHSTDCSVLLGLESVWGIKVNGVCEDVSDLSAPAACKKYKLRAKL